MMTPDSFRRVCVVAVLLSLLAGCADTFVHRKAREQVAEGQWAQALATLEAGVRSHPDSVVLRSSLVQVRSDAIATRIAAAAAARSAGRLDDAVTELQAARALEPDNSRVSTLLAELLTLRRQDAAVVEAEQRIAKQQPESALRLIEDALKDNARHPGLLALSRRLQNARRDAQVRASTGQLAEQRLISLDFRDAPVRTILDVVSRNSGINFVIDRDVRPELRATVLLRNARVEEALDLLIDTNQLARKIIDPQTILVYPNTPEKQREYQDQIIRVLYLANADAKGAANFLRSMIKIREPFVDDRSNMIALRDSPETIRLAEKLLALYDSSEPEVVLEVEVLEISSSRLTELGVKFPDSFSLSPLMPPDGAGLTLANAGDINRSRIGLGVGGLLVNLKRQVGDVSTLANPRIRVRNKEKAKILIGDKIPIITTTTGTGTFVSENVSYLDVGLKLDVEPTIYADDEIAIKIALEVSSLGTPLKTAGGSLAYQIGTRNASTLLRLRDGETQLLAGLMSRDERSSASRVPGLGDLPLLGRLFSSQLDQGSRTELMLAITPRIVRNLRRMDASETELWIGSEALTRLREPRAPAVSGSAK